MGQLIGGCLGTQIEGYTTEQIRRRSARSTDISAVRRPTTMISPTRSPISTDSSKKAIHHACRRCLQWLELILRRIFAEKTAIKISAAGFSAGGGTKTTTFNDWIGAQMRTPASRNGSTRKPETRSETRSGRFDRLHSNNGMLGGIFNACSPPSALFTEDHIRTVVEKAVDMIPHKSELLRSRKACAGSLQGNSSWEPVWTACEERYKGVQLDSRLSNAAAEVIALWFGIWTLRRPATSSPWKVRMRTVPQPRY